MAKKIQILVKTPAGEESYHDIESIVRVIPDKRSTSVVIFSDDTALLCSEPALRIAKRIVGARGQLPRSVPVSKQPEASSDEVEEAS